MYLAIKEIVRNKLRYSLILTTIFLIAFMVFFMTSLALGLVRNNRAAIDNWQATGVVLSDYANDNLTASFIPEKDYKNKSSEEAAPLGYMFAVTNLVDGSEKVNVSIFALDWDAFISPSLTEGRYPEGDDEVVVDQSFENYGMKLGDAIQLNGSESGYKIVGLTQGNKFFTEPVVFTSLATYWTLQGTLKANRSISALVLKNDIEVAGYGLKQISIPKMISKIPGYTPQVNVFSGMILAMIVITGLIVGIFVYIITIQKLGLYGIMRARDTDQNHCMVSVLSNLPPSWYGDCFSPAGNRRSDFSLTSYLFFLSKLDSLLGPKFGNFLDGPSRWCHFTSTLAKGGPDYCDCRVIRRIV